MNVCIGFFFENVVCKSLCVAHMQEMYIGSTFKNVYTLSILVVV